MTSENTAANCFKHLEWYGGIVQDDTTLAKSAAPAFFRHRRLRPSSFETVVILQRNTELARHARFREGSMLSHIYPDGQMGMPRSPSAFSSRPLLSNFEQWLVHWCNVA